MSWQAGGPREQIPVQVQRPEKQESQWCASCLRSGRLETQRADVSAWVWKAGKRLHLHLKAVEQEEPLLLGRCVAILVFYSGPSTAWMRPTHIREGHLLYSICWLKGYSSKNAVTETPRIMFNQISGFLVAQSGCPTKLKTSHGNNELSLLR